MDSQSQKTPELDFGGRMPWEFSENYLWSVRLVWA